MKSSIFKLITFTLLFGAGELFAQVTIAPTNLFINDGERFGTYMVINGSDQNQEIQIDFLFGYSKTDNEGNRMNIYDDSLSAEKHSIAPFLQAFPRNFVLTPGTRRIVRLRIGDISDKEDGTYWARIRTRTVPESPPVEVSNSGEVVARLGINIEQLTGLFYKKGNTTTGIDIDEIRTVTENNRLIVMTDFRKTGNSPFLGTITATLQRGSSDVKEEAISTSLYVDGTLRHELDITNLQPGQYTLSVSFVSERSDISAQDLVQMEPKASSTTVTIN